MANPAIAWLGTGRMGTPMARRLLDAGFAVHAWNRDRAKAKPLAEAGATLHPRPAGACAQADIIITMLADGAAVADVLFQKGAAAAIRKGSLLCDMSSIRPDQARQHADWLSGMGVGHLDAPVSGGTKGAEAGTLAIMTGGEPHHFDRAKAVLAVLGRPVLVGPSGAGQLAKLCNQAIVGITIGAVAEAVLLMRAGGGDPAKLREALAGGFADSAILQQHGRRMVEGDFEPGGTSAVQLKDLDNVMAQARALGIDLPACRAVAERYSRLVNELGSAGLDHSALYLELLAHNGIEAG